MSNRFLAKIALLDTEKILDISKIKLSTLWSESCYTNQDISSTNYTYLEVLNFAFYVSRFMFTNEAIICSILHRINEDTGFRIKDVETEFSLEIANIIDLLSTSESELNSRDILLKYYNSKNNTAILIKILDEIHRLNIRGLLTNDSRLRTNRELLIYFVDLAHSVGLVDLASHVMEKYTEVSNGLETMINSMD